MAGFRMHIGTSTVLGVGYGAAGLALLPQPGGEIPVATCLLATGLCSVSGMLPDLDSGPGVPLREMMAFAAAAVPMLMMRRFSQMGLSHEAMVLWGGILYVSIRFGLAALMRRYTIHRGMFHSLPAAAIAGTLTYLLFSPPDMVLRLYMVGAVLLGFMSHLVLDEIYSVDLRHARLKKSFGTALKFWGDSWVSNLITYALLLMLVASATQDRSMMGRIQTEVAKGRRVSTAAMQALKDIWR